MTDTVYQDMLRGDARGRWVRLRTITTLRWLAVLGQTAAVIAADRVFDLDLPQAICWIVIAASVIFNIVSIQVLPRTTRLSERAAMGSMLFDLAQVSSLLALTGGLTNPFAMLILAPVTISASALTLRSTLVVAFAAFAVITLMARWSLPLAFEDGHALMPPPLYVFGVWAALAISILFMTFYARRVSIETYRMSRAVRAAEAALSREKRLTAIGGLAAAAAHELGTPLATIKLVSSELVDELSDNAALREDAELIRSQADRCRDILNDLRHGGRADEQVRTTSLAALVEEAAEPHAKRGVQIISRFSGALLDEAAEGQPLIKRTPELVHGLRNMIQNAVDFAQTTIWIDVTDSETSLRFVIGDDGPGYPEEVIEHLGDPYIRSRDRKMRAGEGEYRGMGLGLFIAKTLLERTGARVSFANADRAVRRQNRGLPLEERKPSGAVVATVWPRARIVASTADARGPLGENPRFTLQNI